MVLDLAAAAVLGILSGLGLGGGSLLLLYLTARGMAPEEARLVSLLFFFPASLLSALTAREKCPVRPLLPGIAAGAAGAALGALLAGITDPEPFRKALGALLILLGVREVFHRKPKPCGKK